jgi:hypothetical protein
MEHGRTEIGDADTTIKKVEAGSSPKGEMGQRYLVAGKRVSMRPLSSEAQKRGRICTEKADRPAIAFLRQFDLGQRRLLVRAAMRLAKLVTA